MPEDPEWRAAENRKHDWRDDFNIEVVREAHERNLEYVRMIQEGRNEATKTSKTLAE